MYVDVIWVLQRLNRYILASLVFSEVGSESTNRSWDIPLSLTISLKMVSRGFELFQLTITADEAKKMLTNCYILSVNK